MKQAAKHILVVEDERIVAREIQLRLIDLGYEVPTTVASSEDAVRCATERCPDLVLMDIRIRGERDGIETAEIMRGRFDIPVVYLTAHSDDATLARAKQTGPLGYLLKPLKPGELRSAIEIALYKHEMSRKLREREHWFSTTLRSIGDAVISTDAGGQVTFMNPVAETLTGWRSEDAVGQSLSSVLHLIDEGTRNQIDNPIARALKLGKVVHVDASMTSRSGGERSISDSAAPIIDDQGRVLGGVLVFSDVTEQRRLQRQLELSDRLASLGTMAAGVAHEINNPLTYILANLEEAIESIAANAPTVSPGSWLAELATGLKYALDGATRVKMIVADMSVFSRPRGDTSRYGDCARVIRQSIELAGHEIRACATLVTELEAVPAVRIDETRLGQILVNLLINAAHAVGPGAPARNTITVATRLEARGVVLEVTDTGAGMTAAVKARIFEPFFTTKQPGRGTGLGLSICHGIITSVGGAIEIESTLGVGSTVRVIVPVADPVPQREASPSATGPRGRVLIIDDEPALRIALGRALERDHDVTVPVSARTALALLADGQRFDLIICDVMMPELTGMDVFEELLALDPEQSKRMVFLTGGAFSTRSGEFLATTTNPVLEKPFRPTELRAAVHARLAELGLLST